MDMCYITFRSVTFAQRGESVLKREGYQCSLLRAPKWMAQKSCAYALRVRRQEAAECVTSLQEAQVAFGKVICQRADGVGEELMP